MDTQQLQLADADDVADLLAITPRQATRLMNAGKIPVVNVTAAEKRVPLDQLRQWIASRTTPPQETFPGRAAR